MCWWYDYACRFCRRKRNEWEIERAQLQGEMERLARVDARTLDTALRVFELANRAYDLFIGQEPSQQRILLDLVDLARQAGCPVLPPSPGRDILVPGPRAQDGLQRGTADPVLSQQSFDLVMAMIGGLGRYDQADLNSMGMTRYWHPDMMWYGPCGIGTTRSITGFEQHHQKPFLTALPDRKGGHHRVRLGDGPYVATTQRAGHPQRALPGGARQRPAGADAGDGLVARRRRLAG